MNPLSHWNLQVEDLLIISESVLTEGVSQEQKHKQIVDQGDFDQATWQLQVDNSRARDEAL